MSGLPPVTELAGRPVHTIVRDYPETLAVLRRFDVDVPRRGGVSLHEAVDGDAGALLDAIAEAIAWRADDVSWHADDSSGRANGGSWRADDGDRNPFGGRSK